jgi:hypothetical protein
MKITEPPSPTSCPSRPSLFRIGRNSHGDWVVQDEDGMRGGLFVDRTAALRFAMFENGRHPEAVIMVPETFELDLNRKAPPAHHMPLPARRVA